MKRSSIIGLCCIIFLMFTAFAITGKIDRSLLPDKVWIGTKQNTMLIAAQQFNSDGTIMVGLLKRKWNWVGESDTIHIADIPAYDYRIDTLTETHLVYTMVKGLLKGKTFYFDVKKD